MLSVAARLAKPTDVVHVTNGSALSKSPNQTDYLRIENVTKRFGRFEALADVTFSIRKGELVCFLGPSGCGKTTLLRCIAGLETQTEGKIIQNGVDISQLSPKYRDFGIVFQSYALFPNLNAEDNVAFGLRSLRLPRSDRQARVRELLKLAGLEGNEKKFPSQLSGGQQQRVALSRALAMSPGLLLLDEPLSALDAQVRIRLRREIRRLQRQLGVTTIMVTHDQEEALTMADRIVVMDRGRIEQIASGIELYKQPANPFVANFVGVMNFLTASTLKGPKTNWRSGEVCFRPEDASLVSIDPKNEVEIKARIESLEFVGSHFRIMASTQSDPGRLLQVNLSSESFRAAKLREGALVDVFVPTSKIFDFQG